MPTTYFLLRAGLFARWEQGLEARESTPDEDAGQLEELLAEVPDAPSMALNEEEERCLVEFLDALAEVRAEDAAEPDPPGAGARPTDDPFAVPLAPDEVAAAVAGIDDALAVLAAASPEASWPDAVLDRRMMPADPLMEGDHRSVLELTVDRVRGLFTEARDRGDAVVARWSPPESLPVVPPEGPLDRDVDLDFG